MTDTYIWHPISFFICVEEFVLRWKTAVTIVIVPKNLVFITPDSRSYQRAWPSQAAVRRVKHTLECCSSSRLCGSALRGSESRKCAGRDNLIEQSRGALTLKGELKACLMRDGYTCQHCSKRDVRLEAHHIVFREHGGKDTLKNLLTLCDQCHHHLHQGKIMLKVRGVHGHLDQIAQRTMQGKSYLYATPGAQTALSTIFGYQTATLRKARGLPKEHDADALCIATYQTGEAIPYHRERFYQISFRSRRTRRQYYDLPRKGQGRVKYQVNEELAGFRKGDVVRVKGKYVKRIRSIESRGRLAFKRVKGEPANALPKNCQLLERGQTILWRQVA